jgi:hypothetical protein
MVAAIKKRIKRRQHKANIGRAAKPRLLNKKIQIDNKIFQLFYLLTEELQVRQCLDWHTSLLLKNNDLTVTYTRLCDNKQYS